MKSFKEFNESKELLKQTPDGQYITNTHGSHAKELEELKQTPDRQYITNTHGSHSKTKSSPKVTGYGLSGTMNYNESSDEDLPSWEEYLKKNHNPALGANPEEHMKLLNKHNPIDIKTVPHINKYTKSSSQISDHLLRQFHAKKQPNAVVNGHEMGHLDAALNQHKMRHNLVVHSGTQIDPPKLESNKLISHISTSVDPVVAGNFAENQPYDPNNKHNHTIRHVLRITIPKGHPAAIIGGAKTPSGSDVSEYSNEHEVIIPRTDSNEHNTHMRFYKPEKYKDANGVHYHVFPTTLHSKPKELD
jgi:hypothetical protein